MPPAEQRRLLVDGDAPERLWAAWSLALQIGRDVIPALRSVERDDVPDGLRCQLLVILAGLGERQLLETIARADASDTVRATATRLYIRTASRRSGSDACNFALHQLRFAPAVVRRAVLAEQQVGNLSLSARDLLPTLRDSDPETRVAGAICVLAGGEPQEVVGAVVGAYLAEHDLEVRAELVRALPRALVTDVLAAAARGGPAPVIDALNSLYRLFGRLAWTEVASLVDVTTVTVGRAILACDVQPEPPNGLQWLCQLLRLVLDDHSSVARETRWRCLSAIDQCLADGEPSALGADDRSLLRGVFEQRLAECRAELDANGPSSDDDVFLQDLERVLQTLQ